MKKCIVITTINPPTEAIKKFAAMEDWELIIVGDLKTPYATYNDINCVYLSPEEQVVKYPEISKAIGWNTSVRRNIGFIEAYRRGADILALSDDDNIPLDNWGKDLLIGKEVVVDHFSTTSQVFDPMMATNYTNLWHRGYPIGMVNKRNIQFTGEITITPMIQVDFWKGDPDVDALERILFNPEVDIHIPSSFCTNTISPFDSQNTFIMRDLIKFFMLVPGVGRVDDIWGSYLLQTVIRSDKPYIVYSHASVYQKRNEHDLFKDFEQELYGYRNTEAFINKTLSNYDEILKFYSLYQSYF